MSGSNNLITGFQPHTAQSDVQRITPLCSRNAVLYTNVCRPLLFEISHVVPTYKDRSGDHIRDRAIDGGFDIDVLGTQIDKRHFHRTTSHLDRIPLFALAPTASVAF